MAVKRIRISRTATWNVPLAEVFFMTGFDAMAELWMSTMLIETDDSLIVVNTGFPADIAPYHQQTAAWQAEGYLRRQPHEEMREVLAGWGVDPADVDVVALSPINAYATGNLHLFPRAEICCSRVGWQRILAPPADHPRPAPANFLPAGTLDYLLGPAWPRLRLLDDEDLIGENVRVVRSGVHHVSSLALFVDSPIGVVCYTDSAFRRANIEDGLLLGIARSHDEAYESYARIKREADVVLPAYDPEIWQRYPDGVIL